MWTVRLSESADADLLEIVVWTYEKFGERQAFLYEETIWMAVDALSDGPRAARGKQRDDLMSGLQTLHVARAGRKASHILLLRTTAKNEIEVLRILHESMDIVRHLPAADG